MPDPKVHFLNVKRGDCFLLERSSGRVTVIDLCCGNVGILEARTALFAAVKADKPRGNYQMCSKPTNPVDYLTSKGINEIWRFILTHPDMDHMDGIKNLFERKRVLHFWDCGIRREKPEFEAGGPFLEEDWDFYEDLIEGSVTETKVISPRAGEVKKYWDSDDEDGKGDYISIVSPNDDLVEAANDSGDINDASYVIVYRSCAGRIIFPGDSDNKSWDYILENHRGLVADAAVLFAPHHGRKKSDRDYSYLDVVKPRVSFFGCAPSGHLAYDAWGNSDLPPTNESTS